MEQEHDESTREKRSILDENTLINKKEISSLVRQILKLVDQAKEPTPLDRSHDEPNPNFTPLSTDGRLHPPSIRIPSPPFNTPNANQLQAYSIEFDGMKKRKGRLGDVLRQLSPMKLV